MERKMKMKTSDVEVALPKYPEDHVMMLENGRRTCPVNRVVFLNDHIVQCMVIGGECQVQVVTSSENVRELREGENVDTNNGWVIKRKGRNVVGAVGSSGIGSGNDSQEKLRRGSLHENQNVHKDDVMRSGIVEGENGHTFQYKGNKDTIVYDAETGKYNREYVLTCKSWSYSEVSTKDLRNLMRRYGLTNEQVAQSAGMSVGNFRNRCMYNVTGKITVYTWKKVIKALCKLTGKDRNAVMSDLRAI